MIRREILWFWWDSKSLFSKKSSNLNLCPVYLNKEIFESLQSRCACPTWRLSWRRAPVWTPSSSTLTPSSDPRGWGRWTGPGRIFGKVSNPENFFWTFLPSVNERLLLNCGCVAQLHSIFYWHGHLTYPGQKSKMGKTTYGFNGSVFVSGFVCTTVK